MRSHKRCWWLALDGPTQEWHERPEIKTWQSMYKYLYHPMGRNVPVNQIRSGVWCWKAIGGWLYIEVWTERDPNRGEI